MSRNAWVKVTDADTLDTKTVPLSSFEDGSNRSAGTPRLVKVDDDRFCVIWEEMAYDPATMDGVGVPRKVTFENLVKSEMRERSGFLHYRFIDGRGEFLTEDFKVSGELSSCDPAVHDGRIVWYTGAYGASKRASE